MNHLISDCPSAMAGFTYTPAVRHRSRKARAKALRKEERQLEDDFNAYLRIHRRSVALRQEHLDRERLRIPMDVNEGQQRLARLRQGTRRGY